MEAQIPRDTMDEKKSGGRRGRMAFGFVEEQEWKNSSSLLYARCANRKFKTYERRTSSLQTIGQRRQPLSLARQKKKKAIGGKMSPIYKSFFTIWPSISISLPLFSFFSLSLSLSLQGASIHYISKKIFDQLRATPSKQLIVYPQVRRRRLLLLPFVSVLN
jgi:hypothetical protein